MGAVVKLKHTYFYAGKWRWIPPRWARSLGAIAETLGPELTSDAIARSRKLTGQWEAARDEELPAADVETLVSVIREYERSAWFEELKPGTQGEVMRSLNIVRAAPLAKHHVATIERKHVRQFHNGLMQKHSRHKANSTVKWLRRVMEYAIELGLRGDNPTRHLHLKHNPPRRQRWAETEITVFKAEAVRQGRPSLALALQLAYDTAQRPGDVLSARWSQYDGEGISFVQAKTGAAVWAPLSRESKRLLAETSRGGVQIILNETTGRPYDPRTTFTRRVREVMEAAGIRKELQFRDLRRTAASEIMAGGGRIEPLTGHRPGSPALRVYEVPDKAAARTAQNARIGHKT